MEVRLHVKVVIGANMGRRQAATPLRMQHPVAHAGSAGKESIVSERVNLFTPIGFVNCTIEDLMK